MIAPVGAGLRLQSQKQRKAPVQSVKLLLPVLAMSFGCADVETASTTSAINDDPGATTLRFHRPSGATVEIRTAAPPGQADVSVFLMFDSIKGESTQRGPLIFDGAISGKVGVDPRQLSAALPSLAAVVLGLATTEQFTAVTQLTMSPFTPPSDPPSESTSLNYARLTLNYVSLQDGAAGALATAWLGGLGINPCPAGINPCPVDQLVEGQ
jgi:hypothetical protein